MFGQTCVTAQHVLRNTCYRPKPTLPLKTYQHTATGQRTPPNTRAHGGTATPTLCHPYGPFLQPAQSYKPRSPLDWNRKNGGSKKDEKVRKHAVAVVGEARVTTGGGSKVRCGPATKLQPRLPSHGLHRLLSSIRVRVAWTVHSQCSAPSPPWVGWGGGGGADALHQISPPNTAHGHRATQSQWDPFQPCGYWDPTQYKRGACGFGEASHRHSNSLWALGPRGVFTRCRAPLDPPSLSGQAQGRRRRRADRSAPTPFASVARP